MNDKLTGKVGLEGMRFRAYHGVYPEERVTGGAYIVSVWLEFEFEKDQTFENIDETVDYERVYEVTKEVMSEPTPLIETIAVKIGNSLKNHFKKVISAEVKVEKLNPPVKGDAEKSSFVVKV